MSVPVRATTAPNIANANTLATNPISLPIFLHLLEQFRRSHLRWHVSGGLHAHAAVLRLPAIKRLLPDPVAAAHLRRQATSLLFAQNANDLRLVEPTLYHVRLLRMTDAHSKRGIRKAAGHAVTTPGAHTSLYTGGDHRRAPQRRGLWTVRAARLGRSGPSRRSE